MGELLDTIALELGPFACLDEVVEELQPRGYPAIQIEAHALPNVSRILLLLHEPIAWNEQTLDCRSGHDHAMIALLAHAEKSAERHRTNVHEVGGIVIFSLLGQARVRREGHV